MEILQLSAKITEHHTADNSKIFYVFQVTDLSTLRTKTNKLRYSEFRDYHEEIEDLIHKKKLNVDLPTFPDRKLFPSTNKSEHSIQERSQELEDVNVF